MHWYYEALLVNILINFDYCFMHHRRILCIAKQHPLRAVAVYVQLHNISVYF